MPTLRSFRNRLAGIPGGGLTVALCALMAGQGCSSSQPVAVQTTPQRTTTTTTTTTTAQQPSSAPRLVRPEAVATERAKSSPTISSIPWSRRSPSIRTRCSPRSWWPRTYPLDIVAAQQWLAKNPTLKGDALAQAAEQQPWDPSVQALVSLPDALKLLNENIEWTTELGDAFLAQQNEVMDAVQRMRAKAKDGGKLATTEQQKVETKVVDEKTVIEIQPASTEVVYVPTYSPSVIWGPHDATRTRRCTTRPITPAGPGSDSASGSRSASASRAAGAGAAAGAGTTRSTSTTTTTTSTTTTGRTTSTAPETATGSTTPAARRRALQGPSDGEQVRRRRPRRFARKPASRRRVPPGSGRRRPERSR